MAKKQKHITLYHHLDVYLPSPQTHNSIFMSPTYIVQTNFHQILNVTNLKFQSLNPRFHLPKPLYSNRKHDTFSTAKTLGIVRPKHFTKIYDLLQVAAARGKTFANA
jgi:hypothetical protein